MKEQIRALNQIIAFGCAMNAIPIGKSIAEFIFEGFKSINGISDCTVCLCFLSDPHGDIIDDKCKNCDFFKNPDTHSCQLSNHDNLKILSSSTLSRKYGYFAIKTTPEFSGDLLPSLGSFSF